MKATEHDYQGCVGSNFYDNKCNGQYDSWDDFKKHYLGFYDNDNFDDTYHFVFRYDIYISDVKRNKYTLGLCILLQRKGIYTNIFINNINQYLLDTEIKKWLQERYKYMKSLWKEI